MKFKLRNDKENNEFVEFWLEIEKDDVILKAQRKDDNNVWNILSITKEGFLYKNYGLSCVLGLKLDSRGKILGVNHE